MFKKIITYTDFDGVKQTEEFYFNISAPELLELDVMFEPGIAEHIEKVLKEEKRKELVDLLKLLLSTAFGRRSGDGKRFQKDPDFFKEFTETNAYEVFFLDIATKPKEPAEFFNGLMTKELFERAEALKKAEAGELELPEAAEHTPEELLLMSDEEFTAAVGTDPTKYSREVLLVAMQRKTSQ